MSWSYGNKKWSVSFKSLNGTDCRVDIYKRGYTGDTVTTLTGAANPFEYEEGNDEDLLNNVIRYRTGYLRVIENNYGDLADLYPELNTDRYIEFYYNNELDFNGFIQAQEFETPWEPGPREVELPVISPLGLAADTTIDYTAYTPPTWVSVDMLIRQMLSLVKGDYDGYYFPKIISDSYPITTYTYVNTLTFCPFSGRHNKNTDDIADIYDPQSVEDALIKVCTWMGLILHDVPGYVIFQRVDYNDTYLKRQDYSNPYYTPSNTDITAIASIASNDNTTSRVMPLSKIDVTFEGSIEVPNLDFSRCKGYSRGCAVEDHEFCTNSPITGVNDYTGTYTVAEGVNSDGQITKGSICLGAYGEGSLQEMIMFRPASDWGTGKRIAICTFFEWNGMPSKLFFTFRYGDGLGELNNPGSDNIAVIITTGDYYWNGERRLWLPLSEIGSRYSYNWADGREYCEVGFTVNHDLIGTPLTVQFYAPDNDEDRIYTISNIGLKNGSSASDQYLNKDFYNVDFTIQGSPSLVDGSVVRGYSTRCYSLNRMRINKSYITGSLENEIISAEPRYPYLLQAQDRLQIDVKMPRQDNTTIYLNRLTLWGSNNKWRVIAYGFKPWDDTYKLTLHHSSVFDT